MFGNHTPAETVGRGRGASAAATFTRGIQAGTGTQWKFKFDNGFGASVINDGYGSESGLYELAVLDPNDSLTYDTPITSDVLGWLTDEGVKEALDQIAALTADDIAAEITRRANAERDQKIAALRAELAALEAGESA